MEKKRLDPNSPEGKRRIIGCGLSLTVLIALIIVIIVSESNRPDVVPQPLTREEVLHKSFDKWDGSHKELKQFVINQLNDPNSFEHAKTVFWDMKDSVVVSMTFRAKNGFGGVVTNYCKAVCDSTGNILKILPEGFLAE